jgi:aminopeptidase N
MTKTINQLINFFVPSSYDLLLDIDREGRRFAGTVKITGRQVGREIRLHAKNLKISSAAINGEAMAVKSYENDEIGLIGVEEGQTASNSGNNPPGPVVVELSFSGQISETDMHGLYLCFYQVDNERKEWLATQFESHYAREVFPCVDEPAAKATFNLTLLTEDGVNVLSNMPVKSQESLQKSPQAGQPQAPIKNQSLQAPSLQESTPENKPLQARSLQDLPDLPESPRPNRQKTTFETTPKMSTYLLAFAVGDMIKKSAKTKRGIEVNVYATPVQPPESLDFALQTAVKCIDFYESYFGVEYPLPKSDHIALPDFSTGAMENWGLITYRETTLLAGKTAGLSTKQYIATVIAHELSHQWFGNLVTMQWWDDLWLNESFASLMEHIATDALFPDWQMWLSYETGDVVAALRRDALPGVQSVRQNVHHPDEISTLFDPAIVYAKGERLLKMLRAFIGEKSFCDGLQKYFKKFAYSNTTANDLWQCLAKSSGENIAELMTNWLTKPGYPIVQADYDGTKISLSQERFLAMPPPKLKFVIIHGTGSGPQENWFPYVKQELEKRGAKVFVPQFPLDKQQNLNNWLATFKKRVPFELDENTVLIGHSIGATFLLSILNRQQKSPLRASIFVSGFYDTLDEDYLHELTKTFVNLNFDWPLIKQNAGEIFQLHGDDDPHVSLAQAKRLAKKLGSNLTVVKGGGHLNRRTGYVKKFPELLQIIDKLVASKDDQLWPIPLFSSDKKAPKLLKVRFGAFQPSDIAKFQLNIGNNGHFITAFAKELRAKIDVKLADLPVVDKLSNLNQIMLLARAGRSATAEYLDVLSELKHETNWAVFSTMSLLISDLKMFVETDEISEEKLKKFVGDLSRPLYKKLSVKSSAGEDDNSIKLKPMVISGMVYAEDREAIDACLAEFSEHRHDLLEISGDLRSVILVAAVRFGDQEAFDYLLDLYKSTADADLREDICAGLTASRDDEQINRLIRQLTLLDVVRPQDLLSWFACLLGNRYARREVWSWCREKWSWIEETFSGDMSYDVFPRYAGSRLRTTDELSQFDDFFADKIKVPSLRRAIEVGHNDIAARVSWISRDRDELLSKLRQIS